jgi:RecG-like helicase
VGPQRGDLLRKELEISTFGDLLYHYPYRFSDRSQITRIGFIDPRTEYVRHVNSVRRIDTDYLTSGKGGNIYEVRVFDEILAGIPKTFFTR